MTNKTNILLVDDVEYTRELLRMTIKSSIDDDNLPIEPHYFQTSNGKSVLELLKAKHIDLVYLDIDLPDLSGLEILKQIKKDYRNVVVIMVSGENSQQNVMEAIKSGASGFIVKPFNSGRISESLRNYIKNRKLK